MSLDVELIYKKPACKHCGREEEERVVFDANITHNLNMMAKEAGIYQHLWRPEEIGIEFAKDIIKPLENGLEDMKKRPNHYKKFDPPNGWGSYVYFVPWVEKYLTACKDNPDAMIWVSR